MLGKRIRRFAVGAAACAIALSAALPASAHHNDDDDDGDYSPPSIGLCSDPGDGGQTQGDDGHHGHHSWWDDDFERFYYACLAQFLDPQTPECDEDGLHILPLGGLVSDAVHDGVEPGVRYIGLTELVHYLNCTHISPWEDALDAQFGAWYEAIGLEAWQSAIYANLHAACVELRFCDED